MAAITIKIFLGQSLSNQYADLKSAGVLVRKSDGNYRDKEEEYTFLGANFIVTKKSGVAVRVSIDNSKIPLLV